MPKPTKLRVTMRCLLARTSRHLAAEGKRLKKIRGAGFVVIDGDDAKPIDLVAVARKLDLLRPYEEVAR